MYVGVVSLRNYLSHTQQVYNIRDGNSVNEDMKIRIEQHQFTMNPIFSRFISSMSTAGREKTRETKNVLLADEIYLSKHFPDRCFIRDTPRIDWRTTGIHPHVFMYYHSYTPWMR